MPRISAEEDEDFADFEARVADVGKFSDAPLRARAPCEGHVRDAPPSSVSHHVHTCHGYARRGRARCCPN
jgi:hypothetical protein